MIQRKASGHGMGKQPAPLDVLMKFRMIINAVKRHFKWVEDQCGINGAQLWVLWEIGRGGSLRVNDLAAVLAMHQSSTSNLVDKLVKSGLVVRRRDADDQRVVALSLTRKGSTLLRRAPKPARGILPEALHRLPPSALAALDRALISLLKSMKTADKGAMAKPLAEIFRK